MWPKIKIFSFWTLIWDGNHWKCGVELRKNISDAWIEANQVSQAISKEKNKEKTKDKKIRKERKERGGLIRMIYNREVKSNIEKKIVLEKPKHSSWARDQCILRCLSSFRMWNERMLLFSLLKQYFHSWPLKPKSKLSFFWTRIRSSHPHTGII